MSEDARTLAQQALGGEYQLLFNGIEIELYAKAAPTATVAPTIFYIGRHEPRKGLDVLLDAMAFLPTDVKLWVGSDGPDTVALKARAAGDPRIEWLGRLSDAEKAARMRGADVFCAPSLRGESFGVVLLEAMAAHTPVVASDLPGYRNVAVADRDALLAPPGDPAALADALRRVLEDQSLAARLADAGDARAASFSMESLADRYLEVYDGALAAR